MFKHILIPTDGSELAHKAARAGIAFAEEIDAKITLYHALEGLEPRIYGDAAILDPATMSTFVERAKEQARQSMAEIEAGAHAAGIACDVIITKPATPREGIVDAAAQSGCDVIFMASHGRGNLGSLMVGSATQWVLSHSKLPVLVFR